MAIIDLDGVPSDVDVVYWRDSKTIAVCDLEG